MRVYIPSRGRCDERVMRSPAAGLPPGTDVVWVVGPDELADYRRTLGAYGVQGIVLPCALQPQISLVRAWIGKHAARDGLDKFSMMDDDVGFLVRKSRLAWNLRPTAPEETSQMMRWMESALDAFQQVGISAREGNNQMGPGTPYTLAARNTRVMRVVAYQTAAFLAVRHCRTTVMEDFDVTLQILRSGGENLVTYWWAQGQRMTNENGGCSSWRTLEIHEESARRLAELHPGLVSLRQKQNRGDQDGLGTRLEVTVQWKAAAEQGRHLREARSVHQPHGERMGRPSEGTVQEILP